MKKVVIIQQIVPEYRKEFFNKLKSELAAENIELSLIFGNKSSSYKSGNGFTEMKWGKFIINKSFHIGKVEFCWQPVISLLKDKDLIIVEQANKLLLNYVIMVAKHFWGNKLGFWGHGRNLQGNLNGIRNKFGLLFLKKCDWWWAYTQGVKDFLIMNHYPQNRITAVQNAIDTSKLRTEIEEVDEIEIINLKKSLNIIGDKIAIFCGGFYAEKRIDFILECCYILKEKIPDFEMIFIGAGEEVFKVENAAKLNSWIHYVGSQKGKDRIKYFKIACVQLMPGAVGLGILDSFALKTPIISTEDKHHGPEIEYLENGINGIITKNSLKDYSDKVAEILINEEYLDLVEGCIDSAKLYTIENMVQNFKTGILSALKINFSEN